MQKKEGGQRKKRGQREKKGREKKLAYTATTLRGSVAICGQQLVIRESARARACGDHPTAPCKVHGERKKRAIVTRPPHVF